MNRKHFILANEDVRQRCCGYIMSAPIGQHVIIQDPTRHLDQNAKFHAICADLERSGLSWAGKPRDAAAWKVLLVSAHAIATKEGAEIVPGIENEFVNLRESTALMSVKRGSSLIEYAEAFCASNNVERRNKSP